MLKTIFQTRFLVLAIVFFTIINAIAFVIMGIYISFDGIMGMIQGQIHTDERPGLKILESLDVFLVALVFLIFAMGIGKLFLTNEKDEGRFKLPDWMNIHNFTELKLLLWEAVLTTLVVFFISDVVKHEGHYSWEIMVIPLSIALLSLSIYIIKKGESNH